MYESDHVACSDHSVSFLTVAKTCSICSRPPSMLHHPHQARRLPRTLDATAAALINACRRRHLSSVRFLLDRGVSVNVDEPGPEQQDDLKSNAPADKLYHPVPRTPLEIAAENGGTHIVQLLLAHGANIAMHIGQGHHNAPLPTRCNALRFAVQGGHADIVDLLCAAGAAPAIGSEQRWDSYLPLAARADRIEVVNTLLRWGVNMTSDGVEAFVLAAQHGHVAVLDVFSPYWSVLSSVCQYALEAAIQNGHTHIVQHLFEQHIMPCFQSSRQITRTDAIVFAARFQRFDMAELLLSQYDECMSSIEKDIALHVVYTTTPPAARSGWIQLLKVHGARLGANAVDIATASVRLDQHGCVQTLQSLIDLGEVITGLGSRGLIQATHRNYQEAVALFLAHGANVHASDDTAIMSACDQGDLSLVLLLHAAGANLQARAGQAFILASRGGHGDVVAYMLQHQVPTSHTLNVSLHEAVRRTGDLNTIRLLLDHGAAVTEDTAVHLFNWPNWSQLWSLCKGHPRCAPLDWSAVHDRAYLQQAILGNITRARALEVAGAHVAVLNDPRLHLTAFSDMATLQWHRTVNHAARGVQPRCMNRSTEGMEPGRTGEDSRGR